MNTCTALLTACLAGPSLAAPPTVSAPPGGPADIAIIMAKIDAADPAVTRPPAPVETLLEAAVLAERGLAAATDLDRAGELLVHVATAREIAYQRTGAAEHLCRLLAAAEGVLRRPALPSNLAAEAAVFRDKARATLASAHPADACAPPPPSSATAGSEPQAGPQPPASRPVARPRSAAYRVAHPGRTDAPRAAPLAVAGGVLLGTGVVATLGLVGLKVHRTRSHAELEGILAETEAAGGKTDEQDRRSRELQDINTWTRGALIGLGVSAAVSLGVGVGLTIAGAKRRRSQRAQVAPVAGPQGAGLVLEGRF